MKHFTSIVAVAALFLLGGSARAVSVPLNEDITRFLYQADRNVSLFNTDRQRAVQSAVSAMEAAMPSRFVDALDVNPQAATYNPDQVFEVKDLYGDIDGPDGKLWFFYGTITYDYIQHNEYWTEELPKAFEISIYDNSMKLMGTIKDTFVLKDDEVRVRQVSVLPIVTKNYFNQDDNYEIAITVLVNPKPYGLRPYTYVYTIGDGKASDGDSVPVMVLNGMVNEVLDASTDKGENVIMTFINEYNDSGLSEEDCYNPEDPDDAEARENFWKYNLGNKIGISSYGAADAKGNLTKVFEKSTVYYQANGNMQDDPLSLLLVHDGKPVVVYPYYEDTFFNPFYSNNEDMSQRQPNNLIIEVYEQSAPGEKFVLKQTTKIPVVRTPTDDVLCSYFSVGGFRYREDVVFNGDKADFIVTRRDYIASSDSERMSFIAYNADGSVKRNLFENTSSHISMANLKGFDPMELFITNDGKDYIFNFVNMHTFETELSLNYGLMLDGPDGDPDYIMANIERTLTADGKSFVYVAEMRSPGYDDINDISYMRVAWINRDGSFDHFDRINMGNNVKYATLFLDGPVLQPDFYYSDAKQEYMLLIKRDRPDNPEKPTEEQLLIAQVADADNPFGKDILLLGDTADGSLLSIIPIYGEHNRLSVTYGKTGSTRGTTYYYNLPLDGKPSGIDDITSASRSDITVDGTLVKASGLIEAYNLQGILVASGHDILDLASAGSGLYIIRNAGASVKVAVR